MFENPFFWGITAGCMLGIPIGPNGTLCLYRSVRFGWSQGLATALGSVMAMCLHAFISFILLSNLIELMSQSKRMIWINKISGFVLIAIGFVFYLVSTNKKRTHLGATHPKALFQGLLSALVIGIVNPKNIFGFAALLVAIGVRVNEAVSTFTSAAFFGLGVFLATAPFFTILIFLSIRMGEVFLNRSVSKLKYAVSAAFVLVGLLKLVTCG